MRKAHLLVTLAFVCCTTYTMACTNFLFTKGATKDGSTMVTYSADSHVLYGELYHWPAQDWPAGSMLDVYEWDTGKFMGKIPQVAHTYNVVGNMNEHQLAISETTFGGRKELESQPYFSIKSVITTMASRAFFARCNVIYMALP